MDEIRAGMDIQFEEKPGAPGNVNFLSYTTCIFKNTFEDGLDKALNAYSRETGNVFNSYGPITSCSGSGGDPYGDLWQAPGIDSFPNALSTKGFGDFFRRGFMVMSHDTFDLIERVEESFSSVWNRAPVGDIG
jgi:hypothetical protein